MHNSLLILDFFSHVLLLTQLRDRERYRDIDIYWYYYEAYRDIDIYWYYYDKSNKRNDDSDGDVDCGDVNILVGTRQE